MREKIEHMSHEKLRLRRGAVVIGDVIYEPGGAFGPRVQRDYQLVVIHRGSLDLELDGETVTVPKNHGILLAPGHREHFRFATQQETHHSWCAIKPASVPLRARRQFRRFRGPAPLLGRAAALLDLCRLNASTAQGHEPLQDELYLGLATALLCAFARTAREDKADSTSAELVMARMDQFICDEYAQPCSLGKIAQRAGISRQHLLKLCRRHGRPTPMKQLYAKRLDVCANLLLNTGLSMGEIADRSGFVNVFHFSRKFKETYGRSPAAWRRQSWKLPAS